MLKHPYASQTCLAIEVGMVRIDCSGIGRAVRWVRRNRWVGRVDRLGLVYRLWRFEELLDGRGVYEAQRKRKVEEGRAKR